MNDDQNSQVTEVREETNQNGNANVTRQTTATATKVSNGVIAKRVAYYVTGVILVLLALRMVLLLMAANQGTGFVDFVYAVSGVFAAPFFGIFSYEPSYGKSVFEVSSLVAIVVYGLAGLGIGKLFTLTKKTDIA